jgi:hypothetical protein
MTSANGSSQQVEVMLRWPETSHYEQKDIDGWHGRHRGPTP